MSIKIYNGYILKNTNINELMLKAFKWRQDLHGIEHGLTARRLALLISDYIDIYCTQPFDKFKQILELDDKVLNPRYYGIRAINAAYKKAVNSNERIESYYDMNVSMVIYPRNNDIICQLFEHQKEYSEYFKSIPELKSYGYWNNADPPEDTDPVEFESRKDVWEDVLNYTKNDVPSYIAGIPSMNGLVLELVNEINPWDIKREEIVNAIPPLEKRIELMSLSYFRSKLYEVVSANPPSEILYTEDNPFEKQKKGEINPWAIYRYVNKLSTDPSQSEGLTECVEYMKKTLIPITLETLDKELNELRG